MGTKINIGLKIFGLIALLGVLSLYYVFNPTEVPFFPECPFHALTGLYCPGCGTQRALHQLLHGEIIQGLSYNAMIGLVVAVPAYDFTIAALTKVYKRPFRNLLHKPLTTYLILFAVMLFWILRNINIFPFTWLAP